MSVCDCPDCVSRRAAYEPASLSCLRVIKHLDYETGNPGRYDAIVAALRSSQDVLADLKAEPTFATVYKRACELFPGTVSLEVQAWRFDHMPPDRQHEMRWQVAYFESGKSDGCKHITATSLGELLLKVETYAKAALPAPDHEEQLAQVVMP